MNFYLIVGMIAALVLVFSDSLGMLLALIRKRLRRVNQQRQHQNHLVEIQRMAAENEHVTDVMESYPTVIKR
jgi:hypothetical protein